MRISIPRLTALAACATAILCTGFGCASTSADKAEQVHRIRAEIVPTGAKPGTQVILENTNAVTAIRTDSFAENPAANVPAKLLLNSIRTNFTLAEIPTGEISAELHLILNTRLEEAERKLGSVRYIAKTKASIFPSDLKRKTPIFETYFHFTNQVMQLEKAAREELVQQFTAEVTTWTTEKLAELETWTLTEDLLFTIRLATFDQKAFVNNILDHIKLMDGILNTRIAAFDLKNKHIAIRTLYEFQKIPEGLIPTLAQNPKLNITLIEE